MSTRKLVAEARVRSNPAAIPPALAEMVAKMDARTKVAPVTSRKPATYEGKN
jgi:hypothetical protein